MNHHMAPLPAALAYAAIGYLCIPVQAFAKIPMIPWRRLIHASPVDQPYDRWFSDRTRNIAALACDLAVFDCDDANLADLIVQQSGPTPYICTTPHGGRHLYYRRPPGIEISNRVRIDGLRLDLRTTGGVILVPPSKLAVGPYQWLGPCLPRRDELPIRSLAWLKKPAPVRSLFADPSLAIRRARAYLATVAIAVSGQGGHTTTMRVAGILIQKFHLEIDEALPLFQAWSDRCEPPWSEKELLHKLQDAYRLRSTQGETE